MAYLVGAGAAAIVGGAVMGTLAGQTAGAVNAFDLTAAAAAGSNVLGQFLEASLFLVGTVSTLAYFHFSTRNRPSDEAAQGLESRRPAVVEWLARVGQVFIAITLGALFAGVYASAVSAMADRLNFFQQVFTLIQTTFLQ
jgi:hypothetical protein